MQIILDVEKVYFNSEAVTVTNQKFNLAKPFE